jgi:hypothetical protein
LPSDRVLALAEGDDGSLWIGTDAGLACLQGERFTLHTQQEGLASNTVSVLYVDSQGTLWAGNGLTREGGLSAWDGTTWRTYTPSDGLFHPMVNAILEDSEGAYGLAPALPDTAAPRASTGGSGPPSRATTAWQGTRCAPSFRIGKGHCGSAPNTTEWRGTRDKAGGAG